MSTASHDASAKPQPLYSERQISTAVNKGADLIVDALDGAEAEADLAYLVVNAALT